MWSYIDAEFSNAYVIKLIVAFKGLKCSSAARFRRRQIVPLAYLLPMMQKGQLGPAGSGFGQQSPFASRLAYRFRTAYRAAVEAAAVTEFGQGCDQSRLHQMLSRHMCSVCERTLASSCTQLVRFPTKTL